MIPNMKRIMVAMHENMVANDAHCRLMGREWNEFGSFVFCAKCIFFLEDEFEWLPERRKRLYC